MLVLLFATPAYAVQIQQRVIAVTDTAGLLGPQLGEDIVYSDFNSPVLNNAGQVLFKGSLTGSAVGVADVQGVWLSRLNSGILPIARTDTPGILGPSIPGVSTSTFYRNNLYATSLNNLGTVLFGATVDDSPRYNGLFKNTPGPQGGNIPTALTGTDGAIGPNLGSGVEFIPVLGSGTLLDTGEVIFSHSVNQNDPIAGGQQGIWKTDNGNPSLIARVGTTGAFGPGLGSDVEFSTFEHVLARPERNDLIVEGRMRNTVTSAVSRGVFRLTDSDRSLLALSGVDNQLGPQLGQGVQFTDFRALHNPYVNGGAVLAAAGLQGTGVTASNNMGIWELSESGVTPIARSGEEGALGPNLGVGVTFQGGTASPIGGNSSEAFLEVAKNGSRHALLAAVGGGSYQPEQSRGLWVGQPGTGLSAIALTGVDDDLGPGMGTDQVFQWISGVNLNDDGSLFFTARVGELDVPPGLGTLGVWAYQLGELSPILQVGDQIDLNPNGPADLRAISSLSVDEFNAQNAQFVADLTFADGSQALMVFGLLLPGDANGDGQVTAADLVILDANFGQPGTFNDGDFNGDGVVTAADLVILDANFGVGVGSPSTAASTTPIPEPSSLALLGLAGLLSARRRR